MDADDKLGLGLTVKEADKIFRKLYIRMMNKHELTPLGNFQDTKPSVYASHHRRP